MRITPFKPLLLLAGTVFVAAAAAQAQPDVYFDGQWSATIVAADGSRQVSRLLITRFSGTWFGPTGSGKGCTGKKVPVTVQQSNAEGLAFTVWGKTSGPQCRDLTIETKPVADNAFEGTVESVGSIKLVRR